MALSFLEPRFTPRGNTFLDCSQGCPELKRSHSFSGYMSNALEELSEQLLDRQTLFESKAPHSQTATTITELTNHNSTLAHPSVVHSTEDLEDNVGILVTNGEDENVDEMGTLIWPDTDEEESDMEEALTRRETYPTCGSEGSTCSTLSLAALIQDMLEQSQYCRVRHTCDLQCEASIDNAISGVGVTPITTRNHSLLLLATATPRPSTEHNLTKTSHGVSPVSQVRHTCDRQCQASADSANPGVGVWPIAAWRPSSSLLTTATPNPSRNHNLSIQTLVDPIKTSVCVSPEAQLSIDKLHNDTDTLSGPRQFVTTLMLRNLPSYLCQSDLLNELDASGFKGTYDFVYMPQSFEKKESKGFAFINFMSAVVAGMFVGRWHRQHRFNMTPNESLINVATAALQGLEANMQKWACQRLRRIKNPQLKPFVLAHHD